MKPNTVQTYRLARLGRNDLLAAVNAAWPHASTDERREYAWLLTQLASGLTPHQESGQRRRAGDDAAGARAIGLLARLWSALDSEIRGVAVAAGRGKWSRGLETLSEQEFFAAGRSLSELAIDTDDAALLPVLGRVLQGGTSGHVQAAARALLVLSLRYADPVDASLLGIDSASTVMSPPLDPVPAQRSPGDVRALLEAVGAGVACFEDHGRKDVLLAALVLLEGPRRPKCPADPLVAMARDPASIAFSALRTAFRRGRVPLARQRAWVWLREESLAAACLDRLGRAATPEDHRAVLELGHLCLSPARSRSLVFVPIATRPAAANTRPPYVPSAPRLHPEGVIPDRTTASGLSVRARRRFPAFVAALGASGSPTTLALEAMLVDHDPVARLAACRVAPTAGARDWIFDEHRAIARHAALRACSLGIAETSRPRAGDARRRQSARPLARSQHEIVRNIGQLELERLNPGDRSPLSRLAARRLWMSDPSAFADWAKAKANGPAAEGVDALMTVRSIGAVRCVEKLLLSIVRDSIDSPDRLDPKLVATAVACLGELSATRVISVLEGCMARHADPRVRSNAAEALGRQRHLPGVHGPSGRAGSPFDDEHHRVRASVVRSALVTEPKPAGPAVMMAVDVVADMLTDPRPSHRLAGVWVVQRSLGAPMASAVGMKWERVVGRVRWLADEDGDAAIRRRAGVVAHRLNASLLGLGQKSSGVLTE